MAACYDEASGSAHCTDRRQLRLQSIVNTMRKRASPLIILS